MARQSVGLEIGGTKTNIVHFPDGADSKVFEALQLQKPGNLDLVGQAGVRDLVSDALKAIEVRNPKKVQLLVGLAGADNELEKRATQTDLAKLGVPKRDIHILNDGELIVFGLNGPGFVVIVGTGSNCFGRNKAGKMFHVGGYGSNFDDAGSASQIGYLAVRKAILHHERRSRDTRKSNLPGAILGHFEVPDFSQIKSDGGSASRRAVAGLAPRVLALADPKKNGGTPDFLAQEVVREVRDGVSGLIMGMCRQMSIRGGKVDVGLRGGLVRSSAYQDLVLEPVQRQYARDTEFGATKANRSGGLQIAFYDLENDVGGTEPSLVKIFRRAFAELGNG